MSRNPVFEADSEDLENSKSEEILNCINSYFGVSLEKCSDDLNTTNSNLFELVERSEKIQIIPQQLSLVQFEQDLIYGSVYNNKSADLNNIYPTNLSKTTMRNHLTLILKY